LEPSIRADARLQPLPTRISLASKDLKGSRSQKVEHHHDVRDILIELGERRMIGSQEDMIVDVALDMLETRRKRSA
tara:strand:- start:465 stop:692 length:228 start_codon:yes stop_codon:yes gene_type:complete